MRAKASRQIMKALKRRTPGMMRRIEIQILTNLAAGSFGVPSEKVWTLPADKALQRYAAFTERCMEEMDSGGKSIDPWLLYDRAFELGQKIREKTGLEDAKDLQRLVFLLYRNIDITMEGDLPGDITVSHCYFSRFYTPRQCELMSYVDSGIVSGIYGSGHLVFSQRITEGRPCCKACFEEDPGKLRGER